jgi:hypothetical protein
MPDAKRELREFGRLQGIESAFRGFCYLAVARGKGDPSSAASHTGFRCFRSGNGPGPSRPEKDNRK